MEKSCDLVSCDFALLKEIREVVKESIQEIKLGLGQGWGSVWKAKRSYSHSAFYVGKEVTGLRFYDITLPEEKVEEVLHRLKALYPDFVYHTVSSYRDIYIYIRGDRKDGR